MIGQELHTQPIPDAFSAEAEERLERKLSSDAKLEAVINAAQEAAEKPDEFEDFVAARPYRKELSERHGADAAGVVDRFSYYSQELRKNGALAGELIAGDYFAGTNVAKMLHANEKQEGTEGKASTKPQEQTDDLPEHVTRRKLDAILETNIDEQESGLREKEVAEFERAKDRFAALKAENPKLTWQEFFKTTAHTDRELTRDPNFAYRLVAASGVPVTPLQQEMVQIQGEQAQQVHSLQALVNDMERSGELWDVGRHEGAMAQIIKDPNFVKSNDMRADLRRANRIAELKEIESLRAAAEQKNAISKARRAAPVRSAGGMRAAAPVRNSSLDSTLTAALAHMPDDD